MGSAATTLSAPAKLKAGSVPFPKLGLKLSYLLNDFPDLCGGRVELESKTTTEVNLLFQKKITESAKLSFCDFLNQQRPNHPAVGKAVVFISHAWKYHFLDVMDALRSYFSSEPDIIIWFDVFSVNQHAEADVDLDFDWWSHSFKSAIKDFGRTVMVLAPTIVTQSRFEVAMTQSSREQFLKDITSDPEGSINKMLATIDVTKSECSKAQDRERIFLIVQKEVGASKINSMIFERMRTWVIETTEAARRDDPDNFELLNSLACLYLDQGQYSKAEPLYVACLEQYRSALGETHPHTLNSMHNLASLYYSQGHYTKAEPLYVACLEQGRIAFSETHPDTLASMTGLAVLYQSQGQYAKAEPLYVACLEQRRIALGQTHPHTLASMHNLATLYYHQGQYAKAEPLFVACLEQRRIALGETHPDSLKSMNDLAVLYYSQGQYAKAEPLCVACLEQRRIAFGETHPNTLNTMNNLAILYRSQGQYAKAESMFADCLSKMEVVLGADHPDTIRTRNNLDQLRSMKKQSSSICSLS